MGNTPSAPSVGCLYKNQGERIDEIRDKIGLVLEDSRQFKNAVIYDMDSYFNNVVSLYGDYKNDGNNPFYDYLNKNPAIHNSGNEITNESINNGYENFLDNEIYRFKSFDIIGLPNQLNIIYDNLHKKHNDEYEYFIFKNDNKGIIQQYFEKGNNYQKEIHDQNIIIDNLVKDIKKNYGDISNNIFNNDEKIKNINKIKGNITNQSYSVSFFENLLLVSYKELYDAVYTENNVLLNNKSIKSDNYSTDNTRYLYETDKIKYYENINTFLFYFYYLLIIILIFVIFKFNNTIILIKLTFFRIFVLLLILYPLFILRFQDFIYKIFSYLSKNINIFKTDYYTVEDL
jgi:hypothetical protein